LDQQNNAVYFLKQTTATPEYAGVAVVCFKKYFELLPQTVHAAYQALVVADEAVGQQVQ
jgi:hypothetical protein